MAETAAHLRDHVIPYVPVRQWVLSVPRRVRYHLARKGKLRREVLGIFIAGIARWMRRRIGVRGGRHGSVTCIQRFGGHLNLNVHLHSLVLDGLYVRGATGTKPVFVPVPEPTRRDLMSVLERVVGRVTALLVRRGIIDEDDVEFDAIGAAGPESFDRIQAASIQGMLAFGEATAYVGKLGRDPRLPFVPVERLGAVELEGYSLHAGVRIEGDDRDGLEKLCRYVLRPPFSQERFEPLEDGRIAYRMRHRHMDGSTHIVLHPQELLERLAALVPTPRQHLVIYHGVLAPNANWRGAVTAQCEEGATCRKRGRGRCSYTWAEMMKRTFKVDVLACPKCGGRMKFIALIGQDQPDVIEKILRSMGYEAQMPRRAPARDRDPPDEAPDVWEAEGECTEPGDESAWLQS